MKQLYKIIVITLCTVLFTACNSKAVDLDNTNSYNTKDISSQQEKNPKLDLSKAENPDTMAWLYIPGTDIYNPVMQTANNDDYLKRDENGKYDIWGSYFADYYSNLTNKDNLLQNTVIYGHSESTENPDGNRFTQLFRYLDLAFVNKNQYIFLTIGEDELVFQIFAIFFTNTDFYYIDPNPSDQGFDYFIKTINAKNEFVFQDASVAETDKLLTLSACAYRYDLENAGNHRLVVMAKLVESNAQILEITVNPNPQRP